jgi:hypothetical protein
MQPEVLYTELSPFDVIESFRMRDADFSAAGVRTDYCQDIYDRIFDAALHRLCQLVCGDDDDPSEIYAEMREHNASTTPPIADASEQRPMLCALDRHTGRTWTALKLSVSLARSGIGVDTYIMCPSMRFSEATLVSACTMQDAISSFPENRADYIVLHGHLDGALHTYRFMYRPKVTCGRGAIVRDWGGYFQRGYMSIYNCREVGVLSRFEASLSPHKLTLVFIDDAEMHTSYTLQRIMLATTRRRNIVVVVLCSNLPLTCAKLERSAGGVRREECVVLDASTAEALATTAYRATDGDERQMHVEEMSSVFNKHRIMF